MGKQESSLSFLNSFLTQRKMISGNTKIERLFFWVKLCAKNFSIKYWSNRAIDVRKFISELKKHDSILIRTSDSCGNVTNLEFDMGGFNEAISQLYR